MRTIIFIKLGCFFVFEMSWNTKKLEFDLGEANISGISPLNPFYRFVQDCICEALGKPTCEKEGMFPFCKPNSYFSSPGNLVSLTNYSINYVYVDNQIYSDGSKSKLIVQVSGAQREKVKSFYEFLEVEFPKKFNNNHS